MEVYIFLTSSTILNNIFFDHLICDNYHFLFLWFFDYQYTLNIFHPFNSQLLFLSFQNWLVMFFVYFILNVFFLLVYKRVFLYQCNSRTVMICSTNSRYKCGHLHRLIFSIIVKTFPMPYQKKVQFFPLWCPLLSTDCPRILRGGFTQSKIERILVYIYTYIQILSTYLRERERAGTHERTSREGVEGNGEADSLLNSEPGPKAGLNLRTLGT